MKPAEMTEEQLDALRPRRVYSKRHLLTAGPGYVSYWETADIPTLNEEVPLRVFSKPEPTGAAKEQQTRYKNETPVQREARLAYHRAGYHARKKRAREQGQ